MHLAKSKHFMSIGLLGNIITPHAASRFTFLLQPRRSRHRLIKTTSLFTVAGSNEVLTVFQLYNCKHEGDCICFYASESPCVRNRSDRSKSASSIFMKNRGWQMWLKEALSDPKVGSILGNTLPANIWSRSCSVSSMFAFPHCASCTVKIMEIRASDVFVYQSLFDNCDLLFIGSSSFILWNSFLGAASR